MALNGLGVAWVWPANGLARIRVPVLCSGYLQAIRRPLGYHYNAIQIGLHQNNTTFWLAYSTLIRANLSMACRAN